LPVKAFICAKWLKVFRTFTLLFSGNAGGLNSFKLMGCFMGIVGGFVE